MHIAVTCPGCQTRYQLDPVLRGKRMRCPNQICGEVFEVRANDAPGAPPPTEAARPILAPPSSGNVAEMLQILPAEAAEPAPKTAPRPPAVKPVTGAVAKAPSTAAPPSKEPPVRRAARTEPALPIAPEPTADFPGDFPGDDESPSEAPAAGPPAVSVRGTWEAPPVRGTATAAPVIEAPAVKEEAVTPPRPRRRRSLLIIATMLLVLGGVVGIVFWQVRGTFAQNEDERWQQVEKAYREHDFAEARTRLQPLMRDFPESSRRARYRFLAELSDVRRSVYSDYENPVDLQHAEEQVRTFLKTHRNEPLLQERHGDVWSTLHRLSTQLVHAANEKHDAAALKAARELWSEAQKFTAPDGINVTDTGEKLAAEFTRVDQALASHARQQAVLTSIRTSIAAASGERVRDARALAEQAKMQDDAEVVTLLGDLVKAHRAQILFTPADPDEKPRAIVEDVLPSLFTGPKLGDGEGAPVSGGIVLALARGVLYGLTPDRGDIVWARRVGVDVRVLPPRVPANEVMPELVLALSSDSRSVTAIAALTGAVVWQRPLAEPCLGAPVVVDRHLLVPTLSGRVDLLEVSGGRLLGSYQLGQPLSVGGIRQPGTPFVFFPAEDYCVYVLDVAKQECAGILYSRHAPGSLRSLPLVLPGESDGPGGWLILPLGDSAGQTELRAFALPLHDPDQKPAEVPVRTPGETRFAPWHDGGKIALATDTGYFALWGVRQKGTSDPLLFPMLKEPSLLDLGKTPARAQVVHADAQNYWVLARGRLHRLQATLQPQTGPGLLPRWPQPPILGSPLHDAQARRGGPNDTTVLYVATRHLRRPGCLITAVDAESGQLLWQRLLGCVALRPPVTLGRHILIRDADGLFLFDAECAGIPKLWQQAGELVRHEPVADARFTQLTRGRDFLELSWGRPAGTPPKLHILHVTADEPRKPATSTVDLPSLPHGTPALGDGFVLIPLANGVIGRLDLAERRLSNGPDWRGAGIDDDEPGHIVADDAGGFLVTDGNRTLTRLHWPKGAAWETRGTASLSARVVAPPAVLPGKGEARFCVADASGQVTLLDGRLQLVRRWNLPGPVTAGPFVREGKIGCVVGTGRLVWIDPDRDDLLWEFTLAAEVVGEPTLVEGKLIVADVAGQFHALDPATGRPLGAGYTLRANVPPAAAPVAFGVGRLFVPLGDGTIMLLPIDELVSRD